GAPGEPLAPGCGHRRLRTQGLQSARRARGRVPPPSNDASAAKGMMAMRSLLFIPADDEKKLGKGVASGADALILDLEDAVSAARKPAARDIVARYIALTKTQVRRPQLFVRINALDGSDWEKDLEGMAGSGPDGIVLPKARSGEDVHKLSIALAHAE